MNHKTVSDNGFEIVEVDNEYNYQPELTIKLDAHKSDFE